MEDIRSQLLRSTTVPQVNRRVTNFVTIHYNGPSVAPFPNDLALLKADARFHVNVRGWDGLAYHFAVGRDGQHYQCRDAIARLNHSGVPQGNSESLAVFVACGEGDVPPPIQLASLERLLETIGIPPHHVLSHKLWPRATSCPGALLSRWLTNYWLKYSYKPITGTLKYVTNVRDQPDVTSHLLRKLSPGTVISGSTILTNPVKGDSMWIRLRGTDDYIHSSGLG